MIAQRGETGAKVRVLTTVKNCICRIKKSEESRGNPEKANRLRARLCGAADPLPRLRHSGCRAGRTAAGCRIKRAARKTESDHDGKRWDQPQQIEVMHVVDQWLDAARQSGQRRRGKRVAHNGIERRAEGSKQAVSAQNQLAGKSERVAPGPDKKQRDA